MACSNGPNLISGFFSFFGSFDMAKVGPVVADNER